MAQALTKNDVQDVVDSAINKHTIKLFKYLGEEFRKIDDRFEETGGKIDALQTSISNLAGDLKVYHEELLALGSKVDRLERWIHQIAQETGVKLSLE